MNDNWHQRQCFEFADFRLYPHERLLIKNSNRVALTPRVLDLLIVLVKQNGELVSKEKLLTSIWADSFVEEGNISRAVSTLRKNLGAQGNGSDFIETVPKVGYRFIAPVSEVHAELPIAAKRMKRMAKSNSVFAVLIVLAGLGLYTYLAWGPTKPVMAGGLVNLTDNVAEDNLPAWSPDGKKIAFTSNRDGAGDIYVMNSDGSNVTRLTFTPAAESSSVWSPDGTKIVFDSARDGNRELYIMNSDGSNQTRLTFNPTIDSGPVSFSPDGKRIAFSRNASNEGEAVYNYDIFVMNIDGSELRQVTTDPEFDAEPVWSPDGSRIFFTSGRDHNFRLYAISPDGTGEVDLSPNSPTSFGAFAFTADGKQVYCTGNTPEKIEHIQIYLINADGTNRRQLTTFEDKVYRIAYSPTVHKFAISSKKVGNYEIFLMDASDPPNN
jgi:Tol biopolymer transport system component/DNA-binding winged helix-turn-helix (wHTH) protein